MTTKAMQTPDGRIRTFTDDGNGTMTIAEYAPGQEGYEAAEALLLTNPFDEPDVAQTAAYELSVAKENALAWVGRAAGQARMAFITDIPAQPVIYKEKEAEAARYLAMDPEPADLTDFGWIASEVGITATTAQQVAQVYVNKAAIFRAAGAAVEGARLAAVEAIEDATEPQEAEAAAQNAADQIYTLMRAWGVL